MAEAENPFAYITRLADATITEPFEKHPGIFIQAALIEGEGRNVFIEAVFGPNVPAPVYTLNVGGRGSLVLGEREFRDIVSVGLSLFELRLFPNRAEATPKAAAALPVIPGLLSDTSN